MNFSFYRSCAFIFFLLVGTSEADLCADNRDFGRRDPTDRDDKISRLNSTAFMMNDPNWIVDCCGIVNFWQAVFDVEDKGDQAVFFQVWKPTKGATYELVGQKEIVVSGSNSKQTVTFTRSEVITIKPDYRWGWWTAGPEVIKFKDNNNNYADNNNFKEISSLNEGDTQDWSSPGNENNRDYAVRMNVDANNPPFFIILSTTVTISSSITSGTYIYTVSVDDKDPDDVSTLEVAMIPNSKYFFDPDSYEVFTTTSMLTDGGQTHTLRFTVTDQCNNVKTSTLDVTITNEPPVIHSLPASVYVREDVTEQMLLHVINVTDLEGAFVTCSLNGISPASSSFDVRQMPSSSSFGIYSVSSPGFYYATENQYRLTIRCDDGRDSDSETLTVYLIQNTPPVFLNLRASTAITSSAEIGDLVYTVLVNDTDDVSYTLTCDFTPCPFTILSTGDVYVSEDISALTAVGYDLHITVSDGRSTVGPKTLTVTVSDINDPVAISNLPNTFSIPENTAIGTTVCTVSYTDQDIQTHTFSMTSTTANGLMYFRINPTTGEVTVSGPLNYETMANSTFSLRVTVTDPVTSDTETLTIQVTDVNEAPSFSQAGYSISAKEGDAGDLVGRPNFGLSDPDAGDTKSLTLDCGADTVYFSMDSITGEVIYQSNYDLDTVSLPTSITCTVTVTDSGGLTDTANLYITISDDNDNDPVFSPRAYSFHINYYATAGTYVGKVTATDSDSGRFGILTFTLDQSSLPAEHFAISDTGEIIVKATPKDSAMGYATSVTLTATASDIGGKSDSAVVIIVISDTTTISTTTTTDRYRKFLEDPRNIAWFSASLAVLLVAAIVLIYVVYTCHGPKGCGECLKAVCKKRNLPERRQWVDRDFYDPEPRPKPQSPPKRQFTFW